MKLRIVSAIGLLVSFFMPWIDFVVITLSGFNLAKLNRLGLSQTSHLEQSQYYSFLFYLIPMFLVIIIVVELSGYSTKTMAALVSIFTIFNLISLVSFESFDMFLASIQILKIGYYLSVGFTIGLLLSCVLKIEDKIKSRTTDTQKEYRRQMKELS
ncbi:hypothetical protein EDC18_102280 [Natranaerovirga pectinivora]|uniref:Uncharacterized protein n=1 Tax=Natranaerovirga pectinivora TaxID=682400 RepID=A0A4R3MMR5_9FIRM|nr:hypothetical protein [Natranaerovirga pectinivora]TCT16263.1 hypothetical protein EDC18_102280 [Natranaerovirga pectinivora]